MYLKKHDSNDFDLMSIERESYAELNGDRIVSILLNEINEDRILLLAYDII